MTSRLQKTRSRFAGLLLAAGALGLAFSALPALAITTAPAANAAGDVCDICSVNFDLGACESLGGYPYDSTLEDPPPAISNGGSAPSNPAPANPAPVKPAPTKPAPANPAPANPAPANPAPANPATPSQPSTQQSTSGSGTGTSGSSSGSSAGQQSSGTGDATTDEATTETAAAPSAPSDFAHTVDGREVTFTWTAPADGGSPLTAFKLVLNGGTPVEIPADQLEYTITLGAGVYEATLLASNEIGDSVAEATISDIELAGAESVSVRDEDDAEISIADARNASSSSSVAGIAALGGIVLAGGGLLAWWWLRRRRQAAVAPVSAE